MAILIITEADFKPNSYQQTMLRWGFPFRGRQKVAEALAKTGRVRVDSTRVYQAEMKQVRSVKDLTVIPDSLVIAAQLAALGIKEVRVTDNEDAYALLGRIVEAKALPGKEGIVTSINSLEFINSQLSLMSEKVDAVNDAKGEAKTALFSSLSTFIRIELVLSNRTAEKPLLFELLNQEEKLAVIEQLSARLQHPDTCHIAAKVFSQSHLEVKQAALAALPGQERIFAVSMGEMSLFDLLLPAEQAEVIYALAMSVNSDVRGDNRRFFRLRPEIQEQVFAALTIEQKLAILLAATSNERARFYPYLMKADKTALSAVERSRLPQAKRDAFTALGKELAAVSRDVVPCK